MRHGHSSAKSKRTSSATRLRPKAIISCGVGKRTMESTMDFLHDLRGRVIGQPEISTDGFHPYRVAIRDAFGAGASHGVIVKTYSVTHLVKEAQGRYSPA